MFSKIGFVHAVRRVDGPKPFRPAGCLRASGVIGNRITSDRSRVQCSQFVGSNAMIPVSREHEGEGSEIRSDWRGTCSAPHHGWADHRSSMSDSMVPSNPRGSRGRCWSHGPRRSADPPPDRHVEVRGFRLMTTSMPRSSAPPPTRQMPLSTRSADSSGSARSSVHHGVHDGPDRTLQCFHGSLRW